LETLVVVLRRRAPASGPALIVIIPAFSTKIPELKKPSTVSAVLFLVATVAVFIASTGVGS